MEDCSEDGRGFERSELFCKLDNSAEWLLKAVGGRGMRKGGLNRSNVLADLRVSACGAPSPPKPRVEEPDDLMLALDACDDDADGNKRKASHYKLKKERERVLSVVMPEPCGWPQWRSYAQNLLACVERHHLVDRCIRCALASLFRG